MSGGSHNYGYYHLDEYIESMKKYDNDLVALLSDVRDLCHDLEWYESGDYGEDTFNEVVAEFKSKYLKVPSEDELKRVLLKYCEYMDAYNNELVKKVK